MITYKKFPFGVVLLLRLYGSAVLRTSLFAILTALETILLYNFIPRSKIDAFYASGRPYLTIPALAATTSLLIVFRQQAAYGRYVDGRVQLQTFSAALFNVCSLAFSFDESAEAETEAPSEQEQAGADSRTNKIAQARRFRADMVHVLSLLHATSLQLLRCDWELNNLVEHDESKLPAWDSASAPDFRPRFMHYLMPPWNRTAARRRWNAASKLPVIGGVSWIEKRSLRHGALTRLQTFTRQSLTKLPQPSGPSFAGGVGNRTQSNSPATVANENDSKQRSNCFGKSKSSSHALCDPVARFHSLWTSETGQVVRGATERPYRLISAVCERMRLRMQEGGLRMPPPILSTIWLQLSAGVHAFEQCRYLQDTPFPFTWAQLIVILLLVWQAIVPLTVIVSYENRALGVTVAVVTMWTLWAINESSREVEDPFILEPNDLPLARFQYTFNERLLAVAAAAQSSASDFFMSEGGVSDGEEVVHAARNGMTEDFVANYQGGVDAIYPSGVAGV